MEKNSIVGNSHRIAFFAPSWEKETEYSQQIVAQNQAKHFLFVRLGIYTRAGLNLREAWKLVTVSTGVGT
jgi:hypothetical protein